METTWYLILSAFIFAIGVSGVISRRNPLVVLLCLELMLNAGNLALVAFSRMHGGEAGQVFALIVTSNRSTRLERPDLQYADDDGARVDSDPYGELDAVGILHLLRVGLHGALDRERSPDGALRVVLVGYRGAEKGEHLVAHELRDCPLVAAHLLRHETHDLVDQELGALGTELLADRGRADDVGDQRRDDAPLSSGCYGHR